MYEVHRPDFVAGFGHRQWLRLVSHQSFAGFDTQIQFQLSVDTLVVPSEALNIAQVQEAQAKASIAVVVRQAQQPLGDFIILSAAASHISITGLADLKRLASRLD